MERDICGLVLSVSLRINSQFGDPTGANRVFSSVKKRHPSKVTPVVVARPPTGNHAGLQNADEADRIFLENMEACAEVQTKTVLPDLLRLEESIGRCEQNC